MAAHPPAAQLVTCDMTISLDGYTGGLHHPSEGFMRIMEWAHHAYAWRSRQNMKGGDRNRDSDMIEEVFQSAGAYVMGRRMFDAGEEPWGSEPPFHAPVFVLTHRPRDPVVRGGGTIFHFVTEGLVHALDLARAAAKARNVAISGGADTVRQAIDAGLLDILRIHVAPVLLGGGTRLFDGLERRITELEPVDAWSSERVSHLIYRVAKAA
ncbi:dihydrofolate reductase family protein [Phenylobacterium sp.]|uniref:dihydrofolate reductase family protein n=1 Tax=Phenylobacterium sp. TaxID=1871053 RepID=UPI002FCA1050